MEDSGGEVRGSCCDDPLNPPTMCCTGQTAGRPPWRTCCCSAGTITGWCIDAVASGWRWSRAVRSFIDPTGRSWRIVRRRERAAAASTDVAYPDLAMSDDERRADERRTDERRSDEHRADER